ncbi:MAG: DUF2842 domain-containing protein [Acetobacteraceae bacterium]|nr:DUF2842 domain-containing protein [Acetobacteraceae bacterium]
MTRKTIALAAGIAGFIAYLAVAVVLADHVIGLHWAAGLAYYLVAGLIWAWPAAWLVRWAHGRS